MTVLEWILSSLIAVFPPSAFATLLVSIARSHDFRFDSRMRRYSREIHYSFVVANALERRFAQRVTLVFELALRHGEFLRPPRVLCGPKQAEYICGYCGQIPDLKTVVGEWKFEGGGSRYLVTVPYFRALSSWVILCQTNGCEGDVLMHLFVDSRREATIRGSVRPPRGSWRGWGLWAFVTALGVCSYVAPRLVFFCNCEWDPRDSALLGMLVAASSASFLLLWEKRRRPVFGYHGWDSPAFRH
jgi:hypothetical protein